MTTGPDTGTYDALDTGTYEVLRDRLTAQAAELARRTEALNARRTEEFGSTGLALVGTERLRTEHNCVPRDIVSVGDVLLFGHNVFLGLKPETAVADVFALHDRDLNRLPDDAVPGLLDDPAFVREFAALHRYYRQAHLLQLRRVDGKLLAVFQTGEKAGDIRVLRWAVADDGQVAFLDARGDRCLLYTSTTSSRPPTTSSGRRRPARTTSSAATRTSPSRARCSSRRSEGR